MSLANLIAWGEHVEEKIAPFDADVQNTGLHGIENNQLFIHKEYAFPAGAEDHPVGEIAVLRVQRTSNYIGGGAGGAGGRVEAGIWSLHTVLEGVTNNEWSILAQLDNYATAGENVAIYSQAQKRPGAGLTWAGCDDVKDFNTDPANGLIGREIGMFANGGDANGQRVLLHVVLNKRDSAGSAPTAAHGLHILTESGAVITKGIRLNGNFGIGIDLSDADCATASIVTAGRVGVGTATPAVNVDVAGSGGTQVRVVDAAAVDVRMLALSAAGAGVIGTFTDHDTVVFRNNAEVFRADASGLNMAAGKSIKVNGKTVLSSLNTSLPANATDLASAITLLNAMKSVMIANGLAD